QNNSGDCATDHEERNAADDQAELQPAAFLAFLALAGGLPPRPVLVILLVEVLSWFVVVLRDRPALAGRFAGGRGIFFLILRLIVHLRLAHRLAQAGGRLNRGSVAVAILFLAWHRENGVALGAL